MPTAIFKILGSALSIWESKEKTKYQDELIALRTEYYEEYNKPIDKRSDAVLDDIMLKLCILCDSTAAAIGASNPATK